MRRASILCAALGLPFLAGCGRQEEAPAIYPSSSLTRAEAEASARSLEIPGFREVVHISDRTLSMAPIFGNAFLVLEPIAAFDPVTPGDIVAFYSPQRNVLTCHQVVSIEGDYVRTKGVANLGTDIPVPVSSLRGRVVAIIYHKPELGTRGQ